MSVVQTIPFITLPNWIKAATQCGFNVAPIFRDFGVDIRDLQIEQARVSPRLIDQVMQACVTRADSAGRGQYFPFVLGETFAFEYLSDLETFISTSGNLREAARVFSWLREFVNPLMDMHFDEHGREARLVLLSPGPLPLRPYFCEALFASIMKFARALIGDSPGFKAIHFEHPAPSNQAIYTPFFRLPVHFGQDRNQMVFARELLDAPLTGDFPALHQQAESRIAQKLAQSVASTPLSAQLSQYLQHDPQALGAGIARAAAHLKLHPRSLQRRLSAEQTSYFQIQDQVREQLARAALARAPANLEGLSETLGFSDRRSFTRAFKRWTGQSPRAFCREKFL